MAWRKIFTTEESIKFGLDLRKRIEEQGLTVTAAAKMLGISRQALYWHFSGKHQPGRRVVERAVRILEMEVYAQAQRFDIGAFGTAPTAKQPASAVQLLLLPEAIAQVANGNLEVSVLRKDASSLVLEVSVKFAG